jgi:hypothetical protein
MVLYPDTGHLMAFADIPERRYGLAALGYGHKAPRMERAARGWVKRAGHLALQDDALPRLFDNRVGNRHGGKEGTGIGMERIFIKHA